MEEKKKSKLFPILLAVFIVLVVAIIIALIVLHNINAKNKKAFNADMQEICETLNVKISEDGAEYTVKINPEFWRGSSTYEQEAFCSNIYVKIMTALWNHHIMEEPWTPLVWFYVDDIMVATGETGQITIK